MNKLFVLILLFSFNSFAVEIMNLNTDFSSKNEEEYKNIILDFVIGSLCFDIENQSFFMFAFYGNNHFKKTFNSCAVARIELRCLGDVSKPKYLDGKPFCDEKTKFKVIDRDVFYKSFSNKESCKDKYYEYRKLKNCYFHKRRSSFQKLIKK
jgi:hypothetical protein